MKMKNKPNRFSIGLVVLILFLEVGFIFAEKSFNPDKQFKKARKLAFADKREDARQICKRILRKYPDYYDVRIFLARVYAWDKNYSKAKKEVQKVLKEDQDNQAAYHTIVDIEFWSKNNKKALNLVNQGLKYHPTDTKLLYKKARVLNSEGNSKQASQILDNLLQLDPSYAQAQKLYNDLNKNQDNYQADISYRYDTFDDTDSEWDWGCLKSSREPWQLLSLDLSRRMNFGELIGRINYAQRFGRQGLQYELETYPRLWSGAYSYLSIGYSGSEILPNYRAGGEIYQSLAWKLEGSLGWRYMDFRTTQVNTFTLSLGKYYRNYWINIRTYLSPQDVSFSRSWFLHIRRYLQNTDNYLFIMFGYGTSPDNTLAQEQVNYHSSKKVILGGQHRLSSSLGLEWQLHLENDEITNGRYLKSCRYEVGLSYQF